MTRWSLFLQTLSLLHHFLGLYWALEGATWLMPLTGSFLSLSDSSDSLAGIVFPVNRDKPSGRTSGTKFLK